MSCQCCISIARATPGLIRQLTHPPYWDSALLLLMLPDMPTAAAIAALAAPWALGLPATHLPAASFCSPGTSQQAEAVLACSY
jgi:hypothetical protein